MLNTINLSWVVPLIGGQKSNFGDALSPLITKLYSRKRMVHSHFDTNPVDIVATSRSSLIAWKSKCNAWGTEIGSAEKLQSLGTPDFVVWALRGKVTLDLVRKSGFSTPSNIPLGDPVITLHEWLA